jgi:hypothetical protein
MNNAFPGWKFKKQTIQQGCKVKRILIIIGLLILSLGFSMDSNALTTFFDFEDGKNAWGPYSSNLNNYLNSTFGKNVQVVPIRGTSTPSAEWFGDLSLFKSGMLFTLGAGGTIDFDPGLIPSGFKITQVSFTWGIFADTGRIDFGFDVFDDTLPDSGTGILGAWRNNVFTINDPEIRIGDSGPILFDPDWKISRIRFHDNLAHHVGIDNLTIVDNRDHVTIRGLSSVPEPSALLLLACGLVGLWEARRRLGR